MVNLAKLKTGTLLVLLIVLLLTTLLLLEQTSPVLARSAQPNVPCEGYVCEYFPPCIVMNPPARSRECDYACWFGDTLRCMDPGGWRCIGICPDK